MNLQARLLGPVFDPAPTASEWANILALDPEALAATSPPWPESVTHAIARQAAMSARVARSLHKMLVLAAVGGMAAPLAWGLLTPAVLPLMLAVWAGNMALWSMMWWLRVRTILPLPALQLGQDGASPRWGDVVANNDLRNRAQLAMLEAVGHLLALMTTWTAIMLMVSLAVAVRVS